MRRVTGVLMHPRATMAEVVRHPAFITTWVVVLLVVAVCAGLLLSTPIGEQLLVDERVRVTEAMGGRVDDAMYARLQSNPPVSIYLTSGGRLLLTPPVTIAVALGMMLLARRDGTSLTFVTALAIAVHATVVLALQQVIATPLHFAYESLTSRTNLAGLLGVFDEGSWPARLFGAIDIFGLWWIWLLSLGISAATTRPSRRYFWKLLAVYMGIAAIVVTVFAMLANGV
ncbi:MAG TPA: YIP1 family protein [Vicinamibacterales bacterium]|nr:YIP1 family protein [Vicinamibacterales bacterium]